MNRRELLVEGLLVFSALTTVALTALSWTSAHWGAGSLYAAIAALGVWLIRTRRRLATHLAAEHGTKPPSGSAEPDEESGLAEQISSVAKAVAHNAEVLAPLREAATGQRDLFEKLGWSPAASEQIAAQWYLVQLQGFTGGSS